MIKNSMQNWSLPRKKWENKNYKVESNTFEGLRGCP